MVQRRTVTFVAFTALIVLLAGCAAQRRGAGSTGSDGVTAAAIRSEFTGTWRGSFNMVGGDADRQGALALEIKGDGTYRLTWTRKGVTSNESGDIVAKADRVILNSASGQSMTLMRKGSTLHGMTIFPGGHFPHGGIADDVAIMLRVERVPAAASDSDSRGSGSPRLTPEPERPSTLDSIQVP